MTIYIIDSVPDESDLRILRQNEQVVFHRAGSTQTFSCDEARAICHAIFAVTIGGFSSAVTETHLRLAAEREARADAIRGSQSDGATIVPANLKPELDQL